jgi:hypothetical protein
VIVLRQDDSEAQAGKDMSDVGEEAQGQSRINHEQLKRETEAKMILG